MSAVRTLLRPVAVALLLAAGGLLLWPAPAAHACSWGLPPPPAPLPADAVVFEGTLLNDAQAAPGVVPGTPDGYAMAYTFTVERVLHGSVGPRAVIVDPFAGGSICSRLHYSRGRSERVFALPEPITGELRPLRGNYVVPPAPRFQGFAGPSGAALGTWIVLVFLAEIAILGLATLAGVVYLRARELGLEERELALREREAGRRS